MSKNEIIGVKVLRKKFYNKWENVKKTKNPKL